MLNWRQVLRFGAARLLSQGDLISVDTATGVYRERVKNNSGEATLDIVMVARGLVSSRRQADIAVTLGE